MGWTINDKDVRLCDNIRDVFVRVLTRPSHSISVEHCKSWTCLSWRGYSYKMFVGVKFPFVTVVVITENGDHFFEARYDRHQLGKIKKSALVLVRKIINRPVQEVMLI